MGRVHTLEYVILTYVPLTSITGQAILSSLAVLLSDRQMAWAMHLM